MKTEKNGKFGDVLGNWSKRESVTTADGSLPFIAMLGSPRSSRSGRKSGRNSLGKTPEESPIDDVENINDSRVSSTILKRGLPNKSGSDKTDGTATTTDSIGTLASPRVTRGKISQVRARIRSNSNATKMKLKSIGSRIKSFDKPTWMKRDSSKKLVTSSPATKKRQSVEIKELPKQEPVMEARDRGSRPDLKKRMSAQRSVRNHLARDKSRKLNRKKSLARNKSKVCAKRMQSSAAFAPPVFEKDYNEKHVIFKALSSNWVFEDLTPLEIKAFIQAFERVEVHEDEVVIKQGDVGDYFYIIGDGEVCYTVNDIPVGTAGKAESFGELSLLYTSPRAATVTALSEPTKLFRVDQRTFRFIMLQQTKALEQQKLNLLKDLPFLQGLIETDLKRLSAVMTPRMFDEGDCVVRKGDEGDAFYVVHEGELKVTDISVGDSKFDDCELGPGECFGERALLTSEPRVANVIGLTSGRAFSIDRYTFEQVLGKFSHVILKSQDKSKLEGLKLLKTAELDSSQYEKLTSLVMDKTYEKNKPIFEEGKDTDPALYFVREGKVKITSEDGSHTEEIDVGGYFAEDQLLADVHQSVTRYGTMSAEYTVTVVSETCVCGVLTLEDCRTVFCTAMLEDPEPEKRKSVVDDDDDDSDEEDDDFFPCFASRRSSTRSFLSNRGSGTGRVRESIVRSSIVSNRSSVDSLDRKSVLGEGQFGEVWLVSAAIEEDSESFALKVQSKENPDQKGNIDVIRREIQVLQTLDHPFIIDLVHTYETEVSIFMLLSLVHGGELWDRIHREDDEGNWTSGLSQEHAKFYGLVIADTLAYIHSENIVYRDLKPENVLIDEDGYPVLCDFGFAKVVKNKTYTFCGTPNYLAPEVVSNRGHGAAVDHWSLGVLIYEMIAGENPFHYDGMDQTELYEAICQEDYYPLEEDVSPECFDLIDRLLEKEPEKRLGSLKGREKDIVGHEWFDDLDLAKLRCQEIDGPWIPPPPNDDD